MSAGWGTKSPPLSVSFLFVYLDFKLLSTGTVLQGVGAQNPAQFSHVLGAIAIKCHHLTVLQPLPFGGKHTQGQGICLHLTPSTMTLTGLGSAHHFSGHVAYPSACVLDAPQQWIHRRTEITRCRGSFQHQRNATTSWIEHSSCSAAHNTSRLLV